MKHYDWLIFGGRVIDPANQLDGEFDVAIRQGRIAALGSGLDRTRADQGFLVTLTCHCLSMLIPIDRQQTSVHEGINRLLHQIGLMYIIKSELCEIRPTAGCFLFSISWFDQAEEQRLSEFTMCLGG